MRNKKRDATKQREQEVVLAPKTAKPKLPPLFMVYLLNDDYTPMEFVIEVLKKYFSMQEETALGVTLQVHQQGKGICGQFTREIAETKVLQVNEYARRHLHPLMCSMEEIQ